MIFVTKNLTLSRRWRAGEEGAKKYPFSQSYAILILTFKGIMMNYIPFIDILRFYDLFNYEMDVQYFHSLFRHMYWLIEYKAWCEEVVFKWPLLTVFPRTWKSSWDAIWLNSFHHPGSWTTRYTYSHQWAILLPLSSFLSTFSV